jgi:site-specific recombinase XerD
LQQDWEYVPEIELSLIKAVKDALLDYISNGRPDSGEKKIFLRKSAPYSPITTSVIRFEFSKYFKLAGINTSGKKHGPHSFRSSLATSMVNDNVPYEAVRKLLGHVDPDAIKHYAKLDVEKLRLCSIETIKPSGLFKSFLEGAGK